MPAGAASPHACRLEASTMGTQSQFERQREDMVERQLRQRGIRDARVPEVPELAACRAPPGDAGRAVAMPTRVSRSDWDGARAVTSRRSRRGSGVPGGCEVGCGGGGIGRE